MANKESYVVDTYESDFGDTYNDIRFSVEVQDKVGIPYSQPIGNLRNRCGTTQLFSMRKGILIFKDGFSVEIPISSLAQVADFVQQFKANPEVACIELKGEKWKSIPPGILGNSYAVSGIEGATKPPSSSFQYRYYPDGGGQNSQIIRRVSIETLPNAIYLAQQSCLDKVIGNTLSCGSSSRDISPRHFKGQRANETTGGVISRKIIVSNNNPAEIKSCGANIMGNFNCLGYEGTSMQNAGDYYV
ncbi:hypothetical protein VKI21_06840 [Cyanobacterium aponinum UTEX 3222]|uniref:hypothetical protein n=1 Tax=Cyanobacterium aponinum TaxID=379064 RepID=UPI003084A7C6|nr:hypothetical protein VKI21_06840 [Cyanobacterium aponinum UTEX 3222]